MIELLRKRRSIRNFRKKEISSGDLELLQEALLRSPSSRGINPWEFLFVDDPALLAELARSKQYGSEFLDKAALGIVVLGDETRSDVWVEDCSIAAILVQLQAQSLGLGSCWVQIRKRMRSQEVSSEEHVQQLLGIPRHLRVECLIAVGHPAGDKPGHPKESLGYEKIHRNRYDQR